VTASGRQAPASDGLLERVSLDDPATGETVVGQAPAIDLLPVDEGDLGPDASDHRIPFGQTQLVVREMQLPRDDLPQAPADRVRRPAAAEAAPPECGCLLCTGRRAGGRRSRWRSASSTGSRSARGIPILPPDPVVAPRRSVRGSRAIITTSSSGHRRRATPGDPGSRPPEAALPRRPPATSPAAPYSSTTGLRQHPMARAYLAVTKPTIASTRPSASAWSSSA
jgi:hypothetical protein